MIGKALSLIGANSANTIIDATGKANGIYVDGLDNAGLTEVVITGLTVQNANFEGILVTNASRITISANRVVNNDLAFNTNTLTCSGFPAFETNEGGDCGEGIHISGVDHSIIVGNDVENNSGGILVSDDTGQTNDNVIQGNTVINNPYDCGITLASHPAYASGAGTRGVFHNVITGNESSLNGSAVPGSGAGVGLFIAGAGLATYGNVVTGNRLTGNSLPGVAMHQHTPNPAQNLNDNKIIGNYIADNGPDVDVVPTGISLLGTAPVSGTVIMLNQFERQATDIAIDNSGSVVDIHLNSLGGLATGINNINATGLINATENWWGCSKGPGANGCTSVSGTNVISTPFLTAPPQ